MINKRLASILLGGTVLLHPAYAAEVAQSGPALDIGTVASDAPAMFVSADGSVVAGTTSTSAGSLRAVSWSGATARPTFHSIPGDGNAVVNAMSADGTFIVGRGLVGVSGHAMVWRSDSIMATDLGTLGGAASNAVAISGSGSVIVGSAATANGGDHAVKWIDGSASAIDLGTLGGLSSRADGVSADGAVIAGSADLSSGLSHAVSWTNGSTTATDLNTLGGSSSLAKLVSANGRVIAGQAETANGELHAASWIDGAISANDLGDLGGNYSDVMTISADGSVIAGFSYTELGEMHAVSWKPGATSPTDLGTLGGSASAVSSISADGKVMVGYADTSEGNQHATFWAGGATTPTDLGTLGGTSSQASAISADGTVVVGTATLVSGEVHATIWKLLTTAPSTPPPTTTPDPDTKPEPTPDPEPDVGPAPTHETPPASQPQTGQNPVSTPTDPKPVGIDATNTVRAVAGLANDTFSVMESQRGTLSRLQRSCDVGKAGESCYSVSADFAKSGKTTDVTGWVSMAHAFTDNFLAGVTVAHSFWRDLPDSFGRDDNNIGGGFYARWREPTATGNWYVQGSVAANRYDVARERRILGATEAGSGESTVTGWGASLELGRWHDVSERVGFGYYGGLRYSDLKTGGYTETNANFPFTYSDVTSRRTATYLGASYGVALTDQWRWSVNGEIEQDLWYDDPSLTASADYIGVFSFDADAAHTRGSLAMTLAYRFSDAVSVGVTPYVARTVNKDTALGASIDVSGKF